MCSNFGKWWKNVQMTRQFCDLHGFYRKTGFLRRHSNRLILEPIRKRYMKKGEWYILVFLVIFCYLICLFHSFSTHVKTVCFLHFTLRISIKCSPRNCYVPFLHSPFLCLKVSNIGSCVHLQSNGISLFSSFDADNG